MKLKKVVKQTTEQTYVLSHSTGWRSSESHLEVKVTKIQGKSPCS